MAEMVSDRRSFESCSQLVSLIRYQLGDPIEFLNKCHFQTTTYFYFVEANGDYYRNDEGPPYRHTISFAWVIPVHHFSGEDLEPEIVSPFIAIGGCSRKWHLTMKPLTDMGFPLQLEVYLTCDYCKGVSISANVGMDLYKANEKIGNDAVTNVKFDNLVDRHLVYTGPVGRFRQEDTINEDLCQAYTIQGIFNVTNCCEESTQYFPLLKPEFLPKN